MTIATARAGRPGRAAVIRVSSVGRAELLLFWRNRTTFLQAFLTPVGFVGLVASAGLDRAGPAGNSFLMTGMLAFLLLSTVYYPLVSTYVARRETMVLKRLRVGELTDAEILAATASPVVVLTLGQIVLAVAAGAVLLGLPVPVDPPVLVLAMLGGLGVFVLLAAASAIVTPTVELAQVTTLPVLFACMLGSGLILPVDLLPEPVGTVARFLPLTPVVELLRLGWLGPDATGAAAGIAGPAAILTAWLAVAVVAVRRGFRWEPRT